MGEVEASLDNSLRRVLLQYQRLIDKVDHLIQSVRYLQDETAGMAVALQQLQSDVEKVKQEVKKDERGKKESK